MRRRSLTTQAVLALSCLGLLLPEGALAASPSPNLPTVTTADAVLGPGGTLQGVLMNPQGVGVSQARVMILQGPGRAVNATTDPQGRFAISGLRPGTHLLAAAGTVKAYRLWTPEMAPPAATAGVLVVSNEAAVRGQRDWYQWISEHYVLFCCGVATAIIVPCAVIEANQHPASP